MDLYPRSLPGSNSWRNLSAHNIYQSLDRATESNTYYRFYRNITLTACSVGNAFSIVRHLFPWNRSGKKLINYSSVDWINMRGTDVFNVKHFRLIQVLVTVGLILSIAGGTSGTPSSDGNVDPATTSKVGIILYIVAFAGMLYIYFASSGYRTLVPKQERRILLAIGLAIPFILTRLLYSIIAVFVHNHTFSIVGGDVGVRVAMAVIEEFFVTFDFIILGFSLQKLDVDEQGSIANRPWKERKRRNGDHRSGSGHGRRSRDRGSRDRDTGRETNQENGQ